MADNKTVDNGALSDIPVATDEVTYSGDTANVQLVRFVQVTGAEGAKTVVDLPGNATDGLLVNLGANNDVTVTSGSITANAGTNLNTSALALESGGNLAAVKTSVELIDDAVHTDDATRGKSLLMGAVLDDTSPTAITENQAGYLRMSSRRALLVEGVTSGTAVNVAQATAANLNVTEASAAAIKTAVELLDDAINTHTSASTVTGIQILGSDGSAARRIATDTNGELQVDVLSLPALAAGTNNIGDVDIITVNGQAPAFGSGVRGASVQRVTIATDDVVPASQSGTWTVQPGNTANTTAWLVTDAPVTSGGLTTYHLVAAGTTNATNVKASAGQLYGYYIYNNAAAHRKVAFHNTSGTPTAGASIFFTVNLPSGTAANVHFDKGIAFSSGIGITTVTGVADSDSAAVTANDLVINLFYK